MGADVACDGGCEDMGVLGNDFKAPEWEGISRVNNPPTSACRLHCACMLMPVC